MQLVPKPCRVDPQGVTVRKWQLPNSYLCMGKLVTGSGGGQKGLGDNLVFISGDVNPLCLSQLPI